MNNCTTHDVLLAVGFEFVLVLVLSIIFIVPVVVVGLDTLIILDVMVLLMEATTMLDMPVLDTPVLGVVFAALVAPILGAIFAVPATLVGFEFGVEIAGILVEIGTVASCSSYIR